MSANHHIGHLKWRAVTTADTEIIQRIGDEIHVNLPEQPEVFAEKADVPKLFINADPGSILIGRQRELCRAWANQIEVTVKGRHFLQEDSPDEIGRAVADFVRRVRSQ
jgi:pimeloyl-ACP methyl ester carboxylesterase